MKTTMWRRAAVGIATAVLLSAGAVTVAAPATAAVELTWDFLGEDSNFYYIELYLNGGLAGEVGFSKDADDGVPGNAMMALDDTSDGWAVKAELIVGSTTKSVTTQGHNAIYSTGWKVQSGLIEGRTYSLKGCVIGGSTTMCTPPDTVTA
ncbi:MAG TPA: hypothetical protein VGF84_15835 [Micromonosporaceae bacterium]